MYRKSGGAAIGDRGKACQYNQALAMVIAQGRLGRRYSHQLTGC